MPKHQHKPILFDYILSPSKEQIRIKKAIKQNRTRYVLYNTIRVIAMVIGTIVGSLAFTVAINALIQERGLVEVATEFIDKIGRLLR